MRLVVFGLTMSSSWGNGHATHWRGILRGLHALGHPWTFFERDVRYYAEHRDLHRLEGGTLWLYRDWSEVVPVARAALGAADAAIVTSYCPDAREAEQLLLGSGVRTRLFYDLDTPVTLDEFRVGRPPAYVGPRGFADYDLVLSFTGGIALARLERELGARRAVPLYGCVDPDVHRAAPPVRCYRADLSYLGTYAASRQAMLERCLLEPARRLPRSRFIIGGSQYPKDFPWLSNVLYVPHVSPPEHPAFYGSSRLTLNVTRQPMAELGFCPSGRLFEAAACAVPVISDAWPGIETFFAPGTELLLATGAEEVIEALQRPAEELAAIGRSARARALRDHTALRRARELVELCEEASGHRAAAVTKE